MKRVLISVSDKTNLIEFAKFLQQQGYEIISTGGTFQYLLEHGLRPTRVSDITHFPEILDGRVKTLHPNIHAGLLAVRSNGEHMKSLEEHDIALIDMLIVNLYPFFEKANQDISLEEKIEFIDIGGPSMLRSAAKAFSDVTVITDVNDYALVKDEVMKHGATSLETRKELAGKVFNLTSAYDAAISGMLLGEEYPQYLNASFRKHSDLRYGENPHQSAAYYVSTTEGGMMKDFEQLWGKELSFNNIRDMDLCCRVLSEFKTELVCCAVKHSTPCGVAVGEEASEVYQKTFDCDPVSIFGGIVGMNHKIDVATAKKLSETFLEIVMATDFDAQALEILKKKKNLRLIKIKPPVLSQKNWVKTDGGMLVQAADESFSKDIRVVSKRLPSEKEKQALIFSQRLVKYVKSNAIVVSNGEQALGIGGGQVNRISAAKYAIERAREKTNGELFLASDAFFPFRDIVDAAAEAGIKAIIQPGGSINDKDAIQAVDEHGMTMLFTGMRHFLH